MTSRLIPAIVVAAAGIACASARAQTESMWLDNCDFSTVPGATTATASGFIDLVYEASGSSDETVTLTLQSNLNLSIEHPAFGEQALNPKLDGSHYEIILDDLDTDDVTFKMQDETGASVISEREIEHIKNDRAPTLPRVQLIVETESHALLHVMARDKVLTFRFTPRLGASFETTAVTTRPHEGWLDGRVTVVTYSVDSTIVKEPVLKLEIELIRHTPGLRLRLAGIDTPFDLDNGETYHLAYRGFFDTATAVEARLGTSDGDDDLLAWTEVMHLGEHDAGDDAPRVRFEYLAAKFLDMTASYKGRTLPAHLTEIP